MSPEEIYQHCIMWDRFEQAWTLMAEGHRAAGHVKEEISCLNKAKNAREIKMDTQTKLTEPTEKIILSTDLEDLT